MAKSFFEELQSLSEATKRKVMIGVTIVLMIGVIYVWLEYFNGLVGVGSSAGNAQAQTSSANTATIWDNIKSEFGGLVNNPGQYTITPSTSTQ